VCAVLGSVREIVKSDMSVCPSAWNILLPVEGFSLNLIFEDFSEICQKNFKFN
jgi:hypothetical protein